MRVGLTLTLNAGSPRRRAHRVDVLRVVVPSAPARRREGAAWEGSATVGRGSSGRTKGRAVVPRVPSGARPPPRQHASSDACKGNAPPASESQGGPEPECGETHFQRVTCCPLDHLSLDHDRRSRLDPRRRRVACKGRPCRRVSRRYGCARARAHARIPRRAGPPVRTTRWCRHASRCRDASRPPAPLLFFRHASRAWIRARLRARRRGPRPVARRVRRRARRTERARRARRRRLRLARLPRQ